MRRIRWLSGMVFVLLCMMVASVLPVLAADSASPLADGPTLSMVTAPVAAGEANSIADMALSAPVLDANYYMDETRITTREVSTALRVISALAALGILALGVGVAAGWRMRTRRLALVDSKAALAGGDQTADRSGSVVLI